MARRSVEERVRGAAAAALDEQQYVSAIDVVTALGWLSYSPLKAWQQGRMECLEEALQAGPDKITAALAEFRRWAEETGLSPAQIDYIARTRDRRRLRFSVSGDLETERAYRRLWISPDMTDRKRTSLVERLSRPPELAVIEVHKDWTCSGCGRERVGGSLLMMEGPGPHCMECVGLGDLEFLPSGNAKLTRRAKQGSDLVAVVLKWSSARKRYERQGILVEPDALLRAEEEVLTPEERRARDAFRI